MRLENLPAEHLPREDPRTKVPTSKGPLVLVKNFLLSRDPLYGVDERAARYAPECPGHTPEQVAAVRDGRLDATMFRNAAGQGRTAVSTAVRILNHEPFEHKVFIPFQLVTRENVDEFAQDGL